MMKTELEVLLDFRNSVGHAILDYIHHGDFDSISKYQNTVRSLEKIQIALNNCDLLLSDIEDKEDED